MTLERLELAALAAAIMLFSLEVCCALVTRAKLMAPVWVLVLTLWVAANRFSLELVAEAGMELTDG